MRRSPTAWWSRRERSRSTSPTSSPSWSFRPATRVIGGCSPCSRIFARRARGPARNPPESGTTVRLIGAGLPRTATTTQMVALEQLGFGPCYHMRDLLADLEQGLPLWEAVANGAPDWPAIFGAADSTVDWPSARYYRELMDYYPEAKVLLSVRD